MCHSNLQVNLWRYFEVETSLLIILLFDKRRLCCSFILFFTPAMVMITLISTMHYCTVLLKPVNKFSTRDIIAIISLQCARRCGRPERLKINILSLSKDSRNFYFFIIERLRTKSEGDQCTF